MPASTKVVLQLNLRIVDKDYMAGSRVNAFICVFEYCRIHGGWIVSHTVNIVLQNICFITN